MMQVPKTCKEVPLPSGATRQTVAKTEILMNAHGFKVLQQERGIVLILTMLVMVVMSILGLAFLTTAKTEDTIAANYRNHTAAFYAAEAGVESGVAQLKSLLGASPVPTAVEQI